MLMDGVGGISGWRWLFLIEGLITIPFAIAFYVSPSTANSSLLICIRQALNRCAEHDYQVLLYIYPPNAV